MMVKNVDGARWLPGFRPGSRHTRRAMAGAALQPPRSRRGMPDPPESMGRQTTRLASRADGGGDGTFPILFGYISYRIRIVLYLNVS